MSGWPRNKPISQKKIIIVEGRDEAELVYLLLQKLNLTEVQVIDAEGKDKFGSRIRAAFKEPGFEDVVCMAVMRDADADAVAARESALHWIKHQNLPVPAKGQLHSTGGGIKVSVWISPDNSTAGMLEDLFLRCICNEPAYALAVEYVDALIERYSTGGQEYSFSKPSNLAKARSHAVLTATDGPIKSIGIAAARGNWACDHEELDGLRKFLVAAFS